LGCQLVAWHCSLVLVADLAVRPQCCVWGCCWLPVSALRAGCPCADSLD
jgi:hypothetical protein